MMKGINLTIQELRDSQMHQVVHRQDVHNQDNRKNQGMVHKLHCPLFDGSSPRIWIKKCGSYFALSNTPELDKVNVVSLYMTGITET